MKKLSQLLALALTLSSCSKTVTQKMSDIEKCHTIEGSKGIEKCLVERFGWEVVEAQAAGSDYRVREAKVMGPLLAGPELYAGPNAICFAEEEGFRPFAAESELGCGSFFGLIVAA